MSTATDTGTDLGWAVFTSEEHGEACRFRGCQSQATHAGIFGFPEPCTHRRWPYCLAHRDVILQDARKAGGLFGCKDCNVTGRLLRMEALR